MPQKFNKETRFEYENLAWLPTTEKGVFHTPAKNKRQIIVDYVHKTGAFPWSYRRLPQSFLDVFNKISICIELQKLFLNFLRKYSILPTYV